MTEEMKMKTVEYNLKTKDGRHIRKATRVVFEDGYEVNFIERMPKTEAIKQALHLRPILERGWPYPTAKCDKCGDSGWLHGAQEWTPERMRKGTPYKSVRCECRS